MKSAELLYNKLECGGSKCVFAVMALQYLVRTAGYIDVFRRRRAKCDSP